MSKSSKYQVVWTIRNVWRDLRLPMSALATVARKSFNGKFTAKIDFSIRHYVTIADADI